ncbi:hypothetical protein ACIREO_39360 [Streptomyces sp. NPDC102441]|uniref:hypothetical protein n=1 Tax=Streptomyces sp. NPDC102441 TaxID=3366176 RepID=UPI0038242E43
MSDERMPSRIASVFFTVRANGAWRPTTQAPEHSDPATATRHHLRQAIARVLSRHSVLHLEAAQDAANTALLQSLRPTAGLEVTGTVALRVSAADRDLAQEHAQRQQAFDLEREEELRRLAHLQSVLADPDLRRVWWIDRYPDRHSELVTLRTALEDMPRPYEITAHDSGGAISRFTEQFLTTLHTPQQREVFLEALIKSLQTLGHQELTTMATHWQTSPNEGGSAPE